MDTSLTLAFSEITARIQTWLFGVALPYWAAHGVDRQHGGFVEHLDLEGRDPGVDYKRLRVQCRQTYVFAHAGALGFPDGAEIARHGFDFITNNAWLGPEQGWARRLSRSGKPLDQTPDLYDLAFVLFALGWCRKAGVAPDASVWAERTLDFIETRMRHPKGGFVSTLPAAGHREQNPHMHLFEAALVNHEATGEARYLGLCDEIVELFETRFRGSDGQLGEYFTEDLHPAPGEAGQLVEPGHQFEWAWILALYGRVRGRDMGGLISGLVARAECSGVNPANAAVYAVVQRNGLVVEPCSRVWPNTERMKAAIALFETTGADPRRVLVESGGVLLDRYLAREPAGTWTERFDPEGRPAEDKVPSSTLYHLALAFTETLRAADAIQARFAASTTLATPHNAERPPNAKP